MSQLCVCVRLSLSHSVCACVCVCAPCQHRVAGPGLRAPSAMPRTRRASQTLAPQTHPCAHTPRHKHYRVRKCSRVRCYIFVSPPSTNPASAAVKDACSLVTTHMLRQCESDCGHRVVAEPAPSASFGTLETCDVESASSTRPIGPTRPRRNPSSPQLRIFDLFQEPAASCRPHLRPCHLGNDLEQWRRVNHL
jgi:hypothetical protein